MDRFLSLNKTDVHGHAIRSVASPTASEPHSTASRSYVLTRILAFIVLLGSASLLHAQAAPTATRTADLKIGGGYTNAYTDYLSNRVSGGMGYVNYDFRPHLGVEGEFHFVKDGPSNIYQKTYEIGGRYYRTYGKWVPYGKVLYGRGVFNFASNGITYANLAYNLIAGGVGVDYKALPYLYVRGDFEYQNWFGFPDGDLRPNLLTIGVAYHFH
jgi:Outer membrane protein beta-barrel domain